MLTVFGTRKCIKVVQKATAAGIIFLTPEAGVCHLEFFIAYSPLKVLDKLGSALVKFVSNKEPIQGYLNNTSPTSKESSIFNFIHLCVRLQ